MKVSEAFDLYNNYIKCGGRDIAAQKRVDLVKRILIAKIGDKQISKMSLEDVQSWICEMSENHSSNTIALYVIQLRNMLKYCQKLNMKCVSYELIMIPKVDCKPREFLTEYEVSKMIECNKSIRNKFIISLLYSSGIRLSELLSLDRNSINNRQFQVLGKGKKVRVCFIDDRTEQLMNEYLMKRTDKCEALIISNITKGRMTNSNVQLLIKNAARKAGIRKNVTPHVLRHSFATNFIRNNGNIRYLSTLLGHNSLNTTAIYTHVVNPDLRVQYCKYHSI